MQWISEKVTPRFRRRLTRYLPFCAVFAICLVVFMTSYNNPLMTSNQMTSRFLTNSTSSDSAKRPVRSAVGGVMSFYTITSLLQRAELLPGRPAGSAASRKARETSHNSQHRADERSADGMKFDAMDADHDGTISRSEWIADENSIDTNHDGVISRSEWMAAAARNTLAPGQSIPVTKVAAEMVPAAATGSDNTEPHPQSLAPMEAQLQPPSQTSVQPSAAFSLLGIDIKCTGLHILRLEGPTGAGAAGLDSCRQQCLDRVDCAFFAHWSQHQQLPTESGTNDCRLWPVCNERVEIMAGMKNQLFARSASENAATAAPTGVPTTSLPADQLPQVPSTMLVDAQEAVLVQHVLTDDSIEWVEGKDTAHTPSKPLLCIDPAPYGQQCTMHMKDAVFSCLSQLSVCKALVCPDKRETQGRGELCQIRGTPQMDLNSWRDHGLNRVKNHAMCRPKDGGCTSLFFTKVLLTHKFSIPQTQYAALLKSDTIRIVLVASDNLKELQAHVNLGNQIPERITVDSISKSAGVSLPSTTPLWAFALDLATYGLK